MSNPMLAIFPPPAIPLLPPEITVASAVPLKEVALKAPTAPVALAMAFLICPIVLPAAEVIVRVFAVAS